jgi:hypothetical protein
MRHGYLFFLRIFALLFGPSLTAIAFGKQHSAQSPGIGNKQKRLQRGLGNAGGDATTFKHSWHSLHRHDFHHTTGQLMVHATSVFMGVLRRNRSTRFRLAM